ncbi:MAG: hypothetical protein IKB73_03895 [Ruminococcus sp.]|nr:hypothetical protein [Ruminococcus sp.]
MKKTARVVSLLLVFVLSIMMLSGCGDPEAKAVAAVEDVFKAIENRDFLSAMGVFDEVMTQEEFAESEEVLDALFSRMEYKIGETELVNDTTVKVKVSITNADMKEAMGNYLTKALQEAFSNSSLSEEELNQKNIDMLVECLNDESLGTVTIDSEVVVNEVDGEWQISPEKSFLNAMFGGLYDALEGLENLGEAE